MKYFNKRSKTIITTLALLTAITAATPTGTHVNAESYGIYSVYQENKNLGAYESKNVAIREAKKWANSEVRQNGSIIWHFGDTLYKVYQNGKILGAYESKDVAIREAKKWANSEVTQNGSTIWTFTKNESTNLNDGLYRIYQGNSCLGAYSSKDVAIREAKKWANSEVRQNGSIVWSFSDTLYRVYQEEKVIGAYSSKDVAIKEATKWADSEVVQNGSVIWNYEQIDTEYIYYANGSLLAEMSYSTNNFTLYYENGNPLLRYYALDDWYNGYTDIWEIYYENGRLALIGDIYSEDYTFYSKYGYPVSKEQEWLYSEDMDELLSHMEYVFNYSGIDI